MSEKEKITFDGVDVSGCEYYDEYKHYNCTNESAYKCEENPNCYYKQLQREKQKNEKLEKTLKEIAEIAKTKIYTPACFEDPDCPKNGGVGFDNNCDEYCPIITIGKILEKIKEVENE